MCASVLAGLTTRHSYFAICIARLWFIRFRCKWWSSCRFLRMRASRGGWRCERQLARQRVCVCSAWHKSRLQHAVIALKRARRACTHAMSAPWTLTPPKQHQRRCSNKPACVELVNVHKRCSADERAAARKVSAHHRQRQPGRCGAAPRSATPPQARAPPLATSRPPSQSAPLAVPART